MEQRPLQIQRSANSAGRKLMDFYRNLDAEFHSFGNLPLELRREIWRYALHFPPGRGRILRLSIDSVDIDSEDQERNTNEDFVSSEEKFNGDCDCWDTNYHVCNTVSLEFEFKFDIQSEEDGYLCDLIRGDVGLLFACTESRSEYLDSFMLSLPSAGGGLIRFGKGDIIFLLNLDCNILLPGELRVLQKKNSLPKWFSSIYRLAVPGDWYDWEYGIEEPFRRYLPYCTNLKELFVVDYVDRRFDSCKVREQERIREAFPEILRENQERMGYAMKNDRDFAKIKASKLKLIIAWCTTPQHELITSGCRIEIVEDRPDSLEVSSCEECGEDSSSGEDMDQE